MRFVLGQGHKAERAKMETERENWEKWRSRILERQNALEEMCDRAAQLLDNGPNDAMLEVGLFCCPSVTGPSLPPFFKCDPNNVSSDAPHTLQFSFFG